MLRKTAQRFRGPKNEASVRLQRIAKCGDDALLQRRREIDQEIPATDQIHPRQRGIFGDVVPRKNAHLANGAADLVAGFGAGKEAPQTFGRDIQDRALAVNAGARLGDRAVAEVGSKHLDGIFQVFGFQKLHQRNSHRVDFLAGGAAGNPGTNGARPAIANDGRERNPLGGFVNLGIAEEIRDVDQQVVKERLDLVGFLLQKLEIFFETLRLPHQHPAVQPAQNRGLLVLREIDAGVTAQQQEQPVQGGAVAGQFAFRFLQMHRAMGDRGQFLGNPARGKNEIHHPRGDGAPRHAIELGGLVLGEGDSAFRLDALQSQGAVRCRAREHHPHRIEAELVSEGVEESIDRLEALAGRRPRLENQRAVANQHQAVRRDNVNVVRFDSSIVLDLKHGEGRSAGQQPRQSAFVVGIEMLDQDECHARGAGQMAHQVGECFEASGRGADPYRDETAGFRLLVLHCIRCARAIRLFGFHSAISQRGRELGYVRLRTQIIADGPDAGPKAALRGLASVQYLSAKGVIS